MRKPTIHRNGTSAVALYAQHRALATALYEAQAALAEAAPNARDYYVQGDGAFEQAQREHVDRVQRLESIQVEVSELLEYLCPIAFP